MRTLLEILGKYYHWLIFVLLEVVSLVLLFQFNHYQSSVWQTTANAAVGRINAFERSVLDYLDLGRVNERLALRNLYLEQNNEVLRQQLRELSHDSTRTERLQAERMRGIELLPAKVVTNSIHRRNNWMTVSAGTLDGVEPEMGVVCGTGIVGFVLVASEHYSIVTPLLNAKSSVSCRLRSSSQIGFLRWDGRSPLYCVLDDVPRHAEPKVGDIVETSGHGSTFPQGLFVGRVSAVEDSDDGLSYKLRVHLGIDFSSIQDVSIIRQEFQHELSNLEAKADSLNSED